ncbi:hypothetical protein C3K47_10100 [Solitalea longa]|uniref:Uncharacterized protein n=1 Tax=Solitalea longa TaxID=2079460 RepID=A0A2S5A2A5_9SPHI|nr:hypothetical protein [Solitalea longa]POY36706.1 hypothetical protein C3K47_10100 [Solitalea longa]
MKNVYYLLSLVSFVFLLSSCLKNERSNAVIHEKEERPKKAAPAVIGSEKLNFKKTFTGKINKREDVVVNLSAKEGKIKGFAVIKKSGKRIPIEGEIDEEGHLEAKALFETGFKQVLKADMENGELKGGIIDPKNERTDSVSLKENFAAAATPDKDLQWVKDPGLTSNGFKQILWLQNRFDPQMNDSLITITVNSEYVYTCPKPVRAVLGYYSTMAGADYSASDGEPNANYSGFRNLLIDALDFDFQGSDKQIRYLSNWFRKEPNVLKQINNGYFVSYGSSWFRQFDSINMKYEGDSIIVNFAYFDCDMSKSDRWEIIGTGKFKVVDDMIHLIDQKADTVRVAAIPQMAVTK